MDEKKFFNAHHSPTGAFASFTLGYPGASGGLGLELAGPANQNVYIGLQQIGGEAFEMLPFYGEAINQKQNFDSTGNPQSDKRKIKPFDDALIRRDFRLCSDIWTAGDLTFAIYSPVGSIPDPLSSSDQIFKRALIPAVFAEITIDNRNGTSERTALFGYQGSDPYSSMRHIIKNDNESRICGVGQGGLTAICTADNNVRSGLAFSIEDIAFCKSRESLMSGLGTIGALLLTAPAGVISSWKIVICFFRGGIVTQGIEAEYFYSKYFHSIEDVAAFGLKHFDEYRDQALKANSIIENTSLSSERKFMMAHSIRSYYGNTQLLSINDNPLWVVIEGEFRMINTMDLTVDHLFYEMMFNPWTVKNVLDFYCENYSYRDTVKIAGNQNEYPGGISFTHDMGVGKCFSPQGRSAYELPNLKGCYSFMTQEELVNWILCAGVYVCETSDSDWLISKRDVLKSCFSSMLNRDHFDPEKRDGVMDLDSSCVIDGAEINTYDNVDEFTGAARRNSYIAVKCWAAYTIFELLFTRLGESELAAQASEQAVLCASTICAFQRADGTIPALLEEDNQSMLISVIEGLVFPWLCKRELLEENGPYGKLVLALKNHCKAILKKGICLFEDNGWRLSSTSDNSWLSKIYLCQFVAEKILQLENTSGSDYAHLSWLTDSDNSYFAWSDQMRAGKVCGSRYYPRGVTSILWLK
ncbi:MAG: beta-xylosidase [Fibrobacter sp.]|jgi:hypothetical protein|nr:beta-xylosidase [Fibrobacter sp.]